MSNKVQVDLKFLEGLCKIASDCPENHCRNALLLLAIEKNVEYLVDALLPLVENKPEFHRTAILSAVLSNSPAMFEKILDDDTTINTAWNKFGETALHSAAELGLDKMVGFLIQKGADVDARDEKEMTPLHFARSAAVVEALLNGGADINATDVLGNTPLRVAIDYLGDDFEEFVKSNQDEVVHALLLGGAKQEPYLRSYLELEYEDDYKKFVSAIQDEMEQSEDELEQGEDEMKQGEDETKQVEDEVKQGENEMKQGEDETKQVEEILDKTTKSCNKEIRKRLNIWFKIYKLHPGRLVSEHMIKCRIAQAPTIDIKPDPKFDTADLRASCEEEVKTLSTVKFGAVSLLDVLRGSFKFQDLSVVPDGVLKSYLASDSFEKQFPNYCRLVQKSFHRCEKKIEKLLACKGVQSVMNVNLDRSAKKKLLCAMPVDALSTPTSSLKRAKAHK